MSETKTKKTLKKSDYFYDDIKSRFQIDNYDDKFPFSSFLPGVAGEDGVPLWCFYVNRGQGIVSFGLENKDHPISEYLPATWAYQLVAIQGFRTLCNINGKFYEPFQNNITTPNYKYKRSMYIKPDQLEISEVNKTVGLSFEVQYFNIVNRPLPGLVRRCTITNISSKPIKLIALDGLPLVIPSGFNNRGIKEMRRIHEAYANVRLISNDLVPFYASKVKTHDEAEIEDIHDGNFYAAWITNGKNLKPVQPLIDPDPIFGSSDSLITPRKFIENPKIDRKKQVWENRYPCAMIPVEKTLGAGESITLYALIGYSHHKNLAEKFLSQFKTINDFKNAEIESNKVIKELTSPAFTVSANPTFDAYSEQNFLDNVLRGGVPKALPTKDGRAFLHLYSRRHGDLERDYNYFVLTPHPLSDGAGNFRDVLQNRIDDVWFFKDLFDEEIKMFLNLIQADGYNPLGVEGMRWIFPKGKDPMTFCKTKDAKAQKEFKKILSGYFSPGQLLAWVIANEIKLDNQTKWFTDVLKSCEAHVLASGYHGGYWEDHWDYICELLETFAKIYPDKVEEMLTKKEDIGWYNEGAYVLPRSEKHLLRPSGPMQLNCVVGVEVPKTPMPKVSAFGKLVALLTVKGMTFDYEGKGIEMEAGRPGWNDAMNGMPGIFGSSTNETSEVAKLARWLQKAVPNPPDTKFPKEVAEFIEKAYNDLTQKDYNWDRSATIREEFRAKIIKSISGETKVVSGKKIATLIKAIENRAVKGVESSIDKKTGLIHTYFRAKPKEYSQIKNADGSPKLNNNSPCLKVKSFIQTPLPQFIEGQVRYLKVIQDDYKRSEKLYNDVKKSGLFDKVLKMYKLNENLDEKCGHDIGRARTFSRGWFENETVWLHMSYKYLLEVLRNGLKKEFFEDAKTMLVPFMNPDVYGRSLLENSSFIACSNNPDPNTRGRGFVSRLSGSTAEFNHIWIILTAGEEPFFMSDGQLRFKLNPTLPGEWFTKTAKKVIWKEKEVEIPKNAFACSLFKDILLVYHNEKRKDTFGKAGVKAVQYSLDGGKPVSAEWLDKTLALKIRDRQVKRIDVWLG